MKLLSRKAIASLVAGTFIMAGVAAPFIVQASDIQNSPSAQHQKGHKFTKDRQMTPEKAAQHLSETFGVDQNTVLTYKANGMSFRDIHKAAFLANASGKTIEDVMSHKTADNKWKDVAIALGVTKEQMKSARQNIVANGMNKKIGLDKKTTLKLLNQGYQSRDIGMAAVLAKSTNKPLKEILSLRKINNTWFDVANQVGVDKETFKKDIQGLGHGFHHKGYRGDKGHTENK